MEYRIHLNLAHTAWIVSLGVVVSLVTSTVVAARAYQARGAQAASQDNTLTVKGATRKRIRSDRAVWQIRVRSDDRELPAAFAVLERGVERVRAFLAAREFKPEEIGLSAIETATHYLRDAKGNETREVAGYSLNRDCWVTTQNVDAVSAAAGQVTELIQEGILVFSQGPAYYYDGLAELKVELTGAASRDARSRADEMARAAGCRVAEVQSVRMGVLQITRPYSTDVSDYGVYDTSSIEKDVQAVVTATFRIESE